MGNLFRSRRGWLIGLILGLLLAGGGTARAADSVARAVLFYSPSCPHCHIVLEQVLPPLQLRYGAQLDILTIDVTTAEGQALYEAAITAFAVPDDRRGVPALVFDRAVLVGSEEIPAQLPGLIAAALAAGGSPWPAIPGLDPLTIRAAPAPAQSPFLRDPVGNSVALALLLVMIASVAAVALTMRPPLDRPLTAGRNRAVPLLALAGMAIAAYLAVIEVSDAQAVCGPVGDCNAVQQSAYARLFGVLPIGVLGVFGYGSILAAWMLRHYAARPLAHQAGQALPLLALGGTLFSIYLTFLEPFVIGATCLWCVTSAALMTALLWLTAPRGALPTRRGRPRHRPAH